MNPTRLSLGSQHVLLKVAEKSDIDRVLSFLQKHFYPHDIFSKGGTQSREDELNEMRTIDSGGSILAVTDDAKKELIGVALGKAFNVVDGFRTLRRFQNLSNIYGNTNNLNGLIFLEDIKLRAAVSHRFALDSLWYSSINAVHEDFQRLGLSNILTAKSFQRVKELGFSLVFGISITGSHLFQKPRYGNSESQLLYFTKLIDYKDFRGINVFSHFSPDVTAEVTAYKLS